MKRGSKILLFLVIAILVLAAVMPIIPTILSKLPHDIQIGIFILIAAYSFVILLRDYLKASRKTKVIVGIIVLIITAILAIAYFFPTTFLHFI